jgi:CRISPR/Cas system-associated exonuclease Cas4 (RecB family)
MGCNRVLYYRYVGEEPDKKFPPRTLRIFHTGSKIHEQLQGYMNEISRRSEGADVFADEVHMHPSNSEVANQYEINSTTDGLWVVKIPKVHIRFGLEIKSIKAELFKDISSSPSPDNIVQSTVYMACLDLPLFNILYYCKNDSVMAEFPILFDPKIWKAVTDKIDFVRKHAVDEEPPTREAGFHCRYCRYAHICKPPKTTKKRLSYSRKQFSLNGAR